MKYVALLRGISPANPNMRNDKLREVFEGLGFSGVRTLISSGNVVFSSEIKNTAELEAMIEQALPELLGFNSTTIVRSQAALQKLLDSSPFGDGQHTKATNLNITFLKTKTDSQLQFPHTPKGKSYTIVGSTGREVFSVIDLTGSKTPDLMVWLEKQFTKSITTRTYKTIQRVLVKMSSE